jgi:hypothetical protein
VYKYCSPTRSSLLTGRLPIHVNQNNEGNTLTSASGADLRMTTIAQKLQGANFSTHFAGKWHCGSRTPANLPANRGFDTALGFLKGAEDHFNQRSNFDGYAEKYVDLWDGAGPDRGGRNGTYSVFRDAGEAVRVVREHGGARDKPPLYLHIMFQTCHSPYQVPARFLDPAINDTCARTYHGMATAMDEGVGNITAALKAAALWEDTLLVFTADNGAPTHGGSCGNNYPLRGGKTSSFEGGVRTSAFVAGGYVPAAARGTTYEGLIHVADWYATFAQLAGVDPADDGHAAAGVPPIDSLDQWAALTGANGSASAANGYGSPRDEVPLAFCSNVGGASDDCVSSAHAPPQGRTAYDQGALIVGAYKVVFGDQHGFGFWTGPHHPNGTADYVDAGCPDGCLFNIREDPTEHNDLRLAQPGTFAALKARLEELGTTVYQTNYSDYPLASDCLGTAETAARYDGHIGPQCGLGAV